MVSLLLCLALAAPPDLPAETDYSPRLLQQWSRDAGLTELETLAVASIAAKWEAEHDAWRDAQCSRIVAAMERTWKLPVGSAEREAASGAVYALQVEKTARWNRLLANVSKLVRLRGKWPGEAA